MAKNTREASIKLTLDDSAFRGSLAKTKQEVGKLGAASAKAFGGPLAAGMTGARRELGRMGMEMRGMIRYGATLGGAIGFGALIKNAFQMQSIYRNIAFSLGKVSKTAMDWRGVQQVISNAVQQTGQGAEALATAFGEIFRGTGSAEFSEAAIVAIGKAATASGESVETLTAITSKMGDVFKVRGEDVNEVLATLIANTGVGDRSIESMGTRFNAMAGEAVAAGMHGSKGFLQMIGMANALEDRLGSLSDRAMRQIFIKLMEGGRGIKAIEKASGIKFKPGATAVEKMRILLETEKGRKAGIASLGPGFAEFATMVKAGGIAAFDKKLGLATDSTAALARQEKEMAARLQSPKAQFNKALNTIRDAMLQPEFIDSMKSLAQNLPGLAKGVAAVLEVLVKHPLLSVAGIGAGRLAGGALGGALGAALPKLPGALKGLMTQAAPSVIGGGKMSGGALVPLNTAAITANTLRTIATWAGGTALAGAIGYGIGTIINKTVLEPLRNKNWADMDKAGGVAFAGRMTAKSKGSSKEQVKAAYQAVRQEQKEFSTPSMSKVIHSLTTDIMHAVGVANKGGVEEYKEKQKELSDASAMLAEKFKAIAAAVPATVLPETTITSSHRGPRPRGRPRPGAEDPFVITGG